MAIALKIDTATGNLAQFLSADDLDINTISARDPATALSIGANMDAGVEVQIAAANRPTRVLGDLEVDGDLVVQGQTTSIETQTVLVEDNHLYLNAAYTADAAQTGGLVVNYDPTTTTDTVASGGFTGATTVATTGAATFSAGDIVQISGAADPANNGIYEVVSHAANVLTIDSTPTEDFTQSGFTADSTVQGNITHINVAVLRAGTDGAWETAAGNTVPLSFTDLGSGGGNSLQQAYVQGNTIAVTTAEGPVAISNSADTTDTLDITRTFAGAGAGIDIDMGPGNEAVTGRGLDITSGTGATGDMLFVNNLGSGNALNVQDGGTSVLTVSGAGQVSVDPTSGQNFEVAVAGAGAVTLDAGGSGDVILDASGTGAVRLREGSTDRIVVGAAGAVDITAAAASSFSAAAGNLTLDSAAGELVLDDVGSASRTMSQAADRDFDQTGAGEVLNGATSLIGAINRLARAMDDGGQAGILEAPIENGVTITAGEVVAQSTTSGRVTQGNANNDTNSRNIGIALVGGTGDAGGTVLARVALPGNFVSDSGATFTAGNALFAPDGTGRPTATAPANTGDVVQRVGWAHSATEYVLDFGPAIVL